MQDKEIERILKEQADKTEMRDFSLVWEEIKGEIEAPKKEKKAWWQKKFFLAFVPALLVVCIALSPLIIKSLTPPDEVFYTDELIKQLVTADEALDGLSGAKIPCVDLSKFTFDEAQLLCTETMEVKGAKFSFYDENPTTFFATMDLYDKSIKLNLDLEDYSDNVQVNSADVYYKFKQESDGIYDYSVYAINRGVQYLIEYSGISDNLMDFLNKFFS